MKSFRLAVLVVGLAACSGSDSPTSGDDAPTGCTQAADTYESGDTAPSGCAILDRDASNCESAREAAGITGAWLSVSCRVTLTKAADGYYYFAVTAGQYPWASLYAW